MMHGGENKVQIIHEEATAEEIMSAKLNFFLLAICNGNFI